MRGWAMVALCGAVLGCGSAQTTPQAEADMSRGGAGGSGGAGDSGGAVAPMGAAFMLCQRYLDCATRVTPEALATLIDAYGEHGSCWPELPEASCQTACDTGLLHLRGHGCNYCDQDSDCRFDAALTVCDSTHTCTPCGKTRSSCLGVLCDHSAGDVACAPTEICAALPGTSDASRCYPKGYFMSCMADSDCPSPLVCTGGGCGYACGLQGCPSPFSSCADTRNGRLICVVPDQPR